MMDEPMCRQTRANVCIPIGKRTYMSGVGIQSLGEGIKIPTYGMIQSNLEEGLTLPQRRSYLQPEFWNSGNYDFWAHRASENMGHKGPEDKTFANIGHLFVPHDHHQTNGMPAVCAGILGQGPNSTAGHAVLASGQLAFEAAYAQPSSSNEHARAERVANGTIGNAGDV